MDLGLEDHLAIGDGSNAHAFGASINAHLRRLHMRLCGKAQANGERLLAHETGTFCLQPHSCTPWRRGHQGLSFL